jgi:hypothetical protein
MANAKRINIFGEIYDQEIPVIPSERKTNLFVISF